MTRPVFQSLPQNMAGRDFIVGDIHGAYDLVIQGMRMVRFDPAVDRLISVGDLIDRSAGSHRVLEFLQKPYVHAVSGNHDHDFSTLTLPEIRALGAMNWNGMAWVRDVSDDKLLAIRARLAQLPIAMQVETSRGMVGLVHGDVPAGMDWPTFVARLQQGDERVMEAALCGRDRIRSHDESGVAGIDRLFVGHSIQWAGAKRLGNVYAIDTGAVFQDANKKQGTLTMANLVCRTEVLAPARDSSPRIPVSLSDDAGTGPFGAYVAPRRKFSM